MNIRPVSTEMLRHLSAAEETACQDGASAFPRVILLEELTARAATRPRRGWQWAFGGRGENLETMSYLALWVCAWLTVALCLF